MIADLIDSDYSIRLITRNVMAVFSSDCDYIDHFVHNIKHSRYILNNNDSVESESIVSYITRDYNIQENIFRYVKKRFDIDKFSEYLTFFDKNHLLWLHFSELSRYDRLLVEIIIALLSDKRIICLDYFDDAPFAKDMITLLFRVGLENKLIIYPCRDVLFGLNNSTCQCYIRDKISAKIQSRFSEEYLSQELHSLNVRYSSDRPLVYRRSTDYIFPLSYRYSLSEVLLIFLFSIKLFYAKVFNWSVRI